MTDVLNYAAPSAPRRARWSIALWVTLLYPLASVMLLYCQWSVAWHILGHRPQPSIEDPKNIGLVVSVLHFLNTLMLIGLLPAAFAGFIMATVYGIANRRTVHAGLPMLCWVAAWAGNYFVSSREPFYAIVEWWVD